MSVAEPAGAGTVGPDGAARALAAGTAVVLPNEAPLTCVVAGTDPRAVNGAKQRPAGQAVALWAHDDGTWERVAALLDLDGAGVARARRLLTEELLTVLLPLREDAVPPQWLAPAVRDGWTLLFGGRWAPLRGLLEPHPVLFVSSANLTGHPPAATAAEARALFPPDVPVLGTAAPPGVPAGPGGPPRRATTTVRLRPGGGAELHRPGAQDAAFGSPGEYLEWLRKRYG